METQIPFTIEQHKIKKVAFIESQFECKVEALHAMCYCSNLPVKTPGCCE